MKIACVQLRVNPHSKAIGFQRVKRLLSDAKLKDLDIVCFPEIFATPLLPKDSNALAETIPGRTSEFLASIAQKHKSYLIGTLIMKTGEKPENTAIVIDRTGRIVGTYSKQVLSIKGDEKDCYQAGKKMCLFELDGIKCGVLICFDLSSIDVIQKVIETKVKVLFVPAAWGESRKWTAFLQVRAMDTHTFVVGVNRARPKEKLKIGFGHSMVVNPHGRIIAEVQEDETVLVEEIRIK